MPGSSPSPSPSPTSGRRCLDPYLGQQGAVLQWVPSTALHIIAAPDAIAAVSASGAAEAVIPLAGDREALVSPELEDVIAELTSSSSSSPSSAPSSASIRDALRLTWDAAGRLELEVLLVSAPGADPASMLHTLAEVISEMEARCASVSGASRGADPDVGTRTKEAAHAKAERRKIGRSDRSLEAIEIEVSMCASWF